MGEKEKQSGLCIVQGRGPEERVDMADLCYRLGPCDIWACAATKGQVWVHGPNVAGVCDNVCNLGYPQKLFRCPGSGPQPEAMLVSMGHAATGAIPI